MRVHPIELIEAIATVFWVYALLALVQWGVLVARTDRRQHVAHAVELVANLVPVMVAMILVVGIGALIGLPSVVAVIALLFPAGLVFAATLSLKEMQEGSWREELIRLALVGAVSAGVIWYRQIA